MALGEIEVLEAIRPGTRSILADREIDLLDRLHGGHMVIQKGWHREGLIDGGTETGVWSLDQPPPIDLVFGFYHHLAARVDRLVINPSTESGPGSESWPRRFKLFVSDQSRWRDDGWSANTRWRPRRASRSFALPRPRRAM